MNLSRRDFLKLASIVAGGTALSSCAPVYENLARLGNDSPLPQGEGLGMRAESFALVNRFSFGARHEDLTRVAEVGIRAWVREQIEYTSVPDDGCDLRLRQFKTLDLSANDLFDLSDKIFDNQDKFTVPDELRQATLIRQTYSRRQLYERMVEFWSDHFNISTEKGDCFYLKTVDDREVIRPHALGFFSDLLWASAHSPAMLFYLDNQSNLKDAPNENYAREVMELHTLGVDGGYTQQDVMELARCLTGWGMKEHFWRGDFKFFADLHDAAPKKVLGVNIPAGGLDEAERVILNLGLHPSTAHFLGFKISRRFIADEPPAALVSRVAETFSATNGDLRAVMETLLTEGIPHIQPKFKRPADFIISALRLLDACTDGGKPLQKYLARMGQPYFTWPTPDGYPDTSAPWMSNLMPRWQFAAALAQNEIKGTKIDVENLLELSGVSDIEGFIPWASSLLLGAPLSDEDSAKMASALRSAGAGDEISTARVIIAGILASPAFQWK
ncbi:MAG: DUF1800 family protein [Anaerolineae bacterium]|jgi:hypothetical protein|nr:DUF1800 family protein [Anaerolineae bacterium]MBT7191205.1 DUF1800 family protein [Anaerolineae bacterium]MBT7990819.1 DUF1800 family protein [Anaerolineae bacterium]